MLEDIFDYVIILNIALAGVGLYEWVLSYKANHSRYRLLYIAWIIATSLAGISYVIISFNAPVMTVNVALIRLCISLFLAVGAITAEVIRDLRKRGKLA